MGVGILCVVVGRGGGCFEKLSTPHCTFTSQYLGSNDTAFFLTLRECTVHQAHCAKARVFGRSRNTFTTTSLRSERSYVKMLTLYMYFAPSAGRVPPEPTQKTHVVKLLKPGFCSLGEKEQNEICTRSPFFDRKREDSPTLAEIALSSDIHAQATSKCRVRGGKCPAPFLLSTFFGFQDANRKTKKAAQLHRKLELTFKKRERKFVTNSQYNHPTIAFFTFSQNPKNLSARPTYLWRFLHQENWLQIRRILHAKQKTKQKT